ncbi:hypothetical protein H0H92_015118, partial [Tricholoma furcatifolium]
MTGNIAFNSSSRTILDEDLVECGFGRYRPSDTVMPVLDEPIAFLAANYWITSQKPEENELHSFFFKSSDAHSSSENGLENYLVICLAELFKEPTELSKVFTFVENMGPDLALAN